MIPATEPAATPRRVAAAQRQHPLDVFFKPQNFAVIGAAETSGSVGRTLLWNPVSSLFGGKVSPVNLNMCRAVPAIRLSKHSSRLAPDQRLPDEFARSSTSCPALTAVRRHRKPRIEGCDAGHSKLLYSTREYACCIAIRGNRRVL